MATDQIVALAERQLGRIARASAGRALRELPALLADGETPRMLAIYKSKPGIALLALTDRRLLSTEAGRFGLRAGADVPLEHVAAVAHSEGFANGWLELTVAGVRLRFEHVAPKGRATELAGAIRSHMAAPRPQPDADPLAQIARLAALRDAGAISADEFEAAKAALLARL